VLFRNCSIKVGLNLVANYVKELVEFWEAILDRSWLQRSWWRYL